MLLATVAILAITLLFVDFTGIAARWLSFLPKIQLVPALLALNLGALCLLAVLTLVFGRVYCSVICPLGIYQDIVMRLRTWLSPKRKRRAGFFRHSPEAKKLRYGFFAMFLVLVALGLAGVIASSFAGLLDPYSAYGRMASRFALPLWRTAVVPVADMAAESGVYVLDSYPAAQPLNVAMLAVAVLTFVVVTAMAWRGGRDYCNKVCPAGTMLGLLSRFSLLKPAIDTDKCNRCGTCGRKCKASCIDTKNHSIDYSRCVVCMDCIGNCTQGAISYARRRGGTAKAAPDATRRSFMLGRQGYRRRPCPAYRQAAPPGRGAGCSGRRHRYRAFEQPLHSVPAMRQRMPRGCAAPVAVGIALYAARAGVYRRILQAGLHGVLPRMPGRSYQACRCGREDGNTHRARRGRHGDVHFGCLRAALRQLRAALSGRSHTDGERPERQYASECRRERVHRLRLVRIPLPGGYCRPHIVGQGRHIC